ncbi:MAG TPA: hypothetical protein VGJ22_03050 [Anaerolineales bacterium]|jgi:hypothetical protein
MKTPYDIKIEVFIPAAYSARLLDALSKVDVGHIGNYDHCASVTDVRGFWRPLDGADPFDGVVGQLSEAAEHKVEVNCRQENVRAALNVIRNVHPYEQPVVNVIPLANALFDGENQENSRG